MLEKSQNAVFFHRFVCRVSRKVGLLKRRVRRSVLRGEVKNCTPLWRKAHFEVKMYKTPHVWTTFVCSDVEKLHATVAKSTFGSENAKKLTIRDHFCLFRCRKIARRCGEKHICKSKCTKHRMFGALLSVQMSKNCTPLWRKAHLKVKMYKTPHVRSTFVCLDVEKLHATVAKSAFGSENAKKLTIRDHFCLFRCRKIARRCGAQHICKSKCAKHRMFGALLSV